MLAVLLSQLVVWRVQLGCCIPSRRHDPLGVTDVRRKLTATDIRPTATRRAHDSDTESSCDLSETSAVS